ncbi:MAG: AAA family ATPase [Labedaea sp.]
MGVELRETHVALVFLVGDRAYKLKKPVDVGFLDFSTRERRLAACQREVELNRRLAPDVYLGVADLFDVDGSPRDHLVVMRRMPAERRLRTLVESGAPAADIIVALARMIAAFHARADRGPRIAKQGTRDAVLGRWEDSFAQVRALPGVIDEGVLVEIETLTREFLAGREPLFDERVAAGRIVDGHGDLLTDDIFCLDDGPRVLDCLEFDDTLRHLDGLDDICFLAMDLERLGAPDLGELLLERYQEFSADPAPGALREHYLAYRAFVRAKVACVRHRQGDPAAAEQATEHAEITLRHLRHGRVRLVVVGGLPGTGKTTLAGRLADELGAVLLSTDRLRKELVALPPGEDARAPYREGIYTAEHTDRVYTELLRRAKTLLARGESVILDASWTAAAHRDHAVDLARAGHAPLTSLCTTASSEVTRNRLLTRTGSISDADPAIAAALAADMDPWPQAVTVPTDRSPEHTVTRALAAVRA